MATGQIKRTQDPRIITTDSAVLMEYIGTGGAPIVRLNLNYQGKLFIGYKKLASDSWTIKWLQSEDLGGGNYKPFVLPSWNCHRCAA